MLKMNYISVIACLGLLFGTLVESGVVPADASPIPESKTYSSLALCENCTEATAVKGAGSTAELSQPQAPSSQNLDSSTNASSTAGNDVKVAPSSSRAEPTSGSQSHSDVTNNSANSVPGNGEKDSIVTSKPGDGESTTVPPSTTVKPPSTASTVEPTTPKTTPTEQTTTPETTSTDKTTSTTTVTPVPTSPTTSAVPSTSPTVIPTKAVPTTQVPTDKPAEERRFDGPSFIGGIVFALGVTAIAFVAWKFYKARTERNYHTL